jgi:LysR family carnitine catabolism transcriptional activator
MNVDLRHLEAFTAVARHASFTRAAQSLNISQPTFTVQIRQLEEALGVRLLDRTTRSVQLTHAGRELAPHVERLLRELTTLLTNTAALSGKTSGHVSVAALPSLCGSMLPSVIAAFGAKHIGISVQLLDVTGAKISAMVKSGEVDFGFGSVQKNDPDIEFTLLFRDRMHAMFLRGGALEGRKSIALKDLAALPLILMSRDSTVRTVVDSGLASVGYFAPPAYEAIYMSTALAMVRAGLGVTILPSSALDAESRTDFVSIPVSGPNLDRDIGFIQRRGRSLTPAAEAFLQAIRKSRVRKSM